MNRNIYEIMGRLKDILPEKRYIHSIGVMYTAISLAMAHGKSLEKATLAGLLHDCAKYMSSDEIYDFCIENKIPVTESDNMARQLLHCKAGVFIAKKEYGITDEEILSSIRWHTTGKDNMTDLEKIIFIADYIEPNRKPLRRISEIRKIAFSDLDKACAIILDNTIDYLYNYTDRHVDEMSLKAFNYYKKFLV